MKTKREIRREFFAVLAELRSKTVKTREVFEFLKCRLKTLFWVLDKDISEDFAKQADRILNTEWEEYHNKD